MSTTQHVAPAPRELAHRTTDGLEVLLLWRPGSEELTVAVHDWRAGTAFEVHVGDRSAMHVFHHPYAYAARDGLLDGPSELPEPDEPA